MSIVVESNEFNASFAVTDLLMKTLENAAKTVAIKCVEECGSKYGFNASDAIKMLGLENLALTRKLMAKKSATKTEKAPKAKKEAAVPLPFCQDLIKADCCTGLAFNRGLFTQCLKKPMENGSYCKTCQAEADANASGVPTCGNLGMRLAVGLYEYKDTKGRSPVSYLKVLTKLKFTPEQAVDAAEAAKAILDEDHFQVIEKSKKSAAGSRGRPKKSPSEINANGADDLFNQMQAGAENGEITPETTPSKRAKLTDEEKAEKKAKLEKERAEKKDAREAAKLAEKNAKETAKKLASEGKTLDELLAADIPETIASEAVAFFAKKFQEKAEKDAKIAAEKAEREAKRNAEKAEREAKKNAEKAAKEAEKEAKKQQKEAEKTSKKSPAKVSEPIATVAPVIEAAAPAPAPQKLKVTRITIDGIQYLKDPENVLYNPSTKEEVGIYDPETKAILPLPDDDEIAEDEYEN
ncbi:MAG: hypothetical protein RLZ10_688 [Bacteroidota bacterium]|jgi:chemotaxis protein histidine kinase CheA